MLITSLLDAKEMDFLCREDYDDTPEHVELKERLRKTFYYGRNPTIDRPSLPMTELAVEFLRDAAPRQLGQVDMYWASSVTRRAAVSPCSMILGMMYIDRLKHKNPEYLQQISSSELFLISMMLASKYLYDEGVTEEVFNDEWAESAKMDTEDINEMEREFLDAIDWSLYTHAEDFWRSLEGMERNIAARMGRQSGHFSYTDLHTLTGTESMSLTLLTVLQDLLKVMMACSLAYIAGTMTMAASPVALTTVQSRLPALTSLPFALPGQNSKLMPGLEESEVMTGSELESGWVGGVLPEENETSPEPPAHLYLSPHAPTLGPVHRPPTLDAVPPARGHLGLPGLLTLALLKDTVIGFTTSLLDTTTSDDNPDMCLACRCNHDDDPCQTPTWCYRCELTQSELSQPEPESLVSGNSGARQNSPNHRKSHDPHWSSDWLDRCDASATLFSSSMERVKSTFSDIHLGFRTASQIPLAA